MYDDSGLHVTTIGKRESILPQVNVNQSKSPTFYVYCTIFIAITTVVGVSIVILTYPSRSKKCIATYKTTLPDRFVQRSRSQSLTVAYLNHDLILDVIVANTLSNSIGVLFGYSNQTFSNQKLYSTGENSLPFHVAAADLDSDNRTDIIVSNYGTNSISVFFSYSDESFDDNKTYSSGSSRPMNILIADFNNDNQLDIATVNYGTESIGIFISIGRRIFSKQIITRTGFDSFPRSFVSADFNHDNNIDLAVVNFNTNNILILLGVGNGSFSNGIQYSTDGRQPVAIVVANFNEDHEVDIIVADFVDGSLYLFVGNGDGTFQNRHRIFNLTGSKPSAICTSDFNNDKILDLAITNSGRDNITLLLGYGDGRFSFYNIYSTGPRSEPVSVVCRDLNEDNRPDLLVTNSGTNNIGLIFAYDLGAFTSGQLIASDEYRSPYSIAFADFNNDNQLDIVVTDMLKNSVVIFFGSENGTFSENFASDTNSTGPISIGIADFNMDHYLDVAIASLESETITVLLGYGKEYFQIRNTYSTGKDSKPSFLITADLNNDSYVDIVVTAPGHSSILVFFGFGNGAFKNSDKYFMGKNSRPESIVIHDFNGDDYLDMAVANSDTNNIVILRGLGNGSFYIYERYSTGDETDPSSVAVGDFNEDDVIDFVVTYEFSNQFAIFLGSGNGTFRLNKIYEAGKYTKPVFVSTGDFNKDGHLDLAIVCVFTHKVLLFFGYGNGMFPHQNYELTSDGTYPRSIVIADFNHDQREDIIVAYSDNEVQIFFGYDKPGYQTQVTYATGRSPTPYSLAFGDFNQDDLLDIAIANYGTDNVGVRFGFGNGTFTNETFYSTGTNSGPHFILSCDINNDTKQDLIVANSDSDNFDIFIGLGDGSFKSQTRYSTGFGSQPYSVGTADFNEDGRMDVVVANYGHDDVAMFLGYETITFSSERIFSTSSFPNSLGIGDFNSDNKIDIVVGNLYGRTINVLFGAGDGNFIREDKYPLPDLTAITSIIVGDFNSDNKTDFIAADSDNDCLYVFLGSLNGTFLTRKTIKLATYSGPKALAIGNFNADNYLDVAIANYFSNSLTILLGTGNGSFGKGKNYKYSSRNLIDLAVADFNNDQILDIALAYNVSDDIIILLGHENGSFILHETYSTGINSIPQSIAIGDINNDRNVDIVVGNSNTEFIGVLYGFGNGSLQSQVVYSTGAGIGPTFVAIVDLNRDGQLDVVVTKRYRSELIVLLGYEGKLFKTDSAYSTGFQSEPLVIAIADFNGDNHLDIAVENYATSNIAIFSGHVDEGFLPLITVSTGRNSYPYAIAIGHFNNDGRLDIAIANSGTHNIGIFLYNEHNVFTNQITYLTGNNSNPRSISTADFNNDTLIDLVVANYDNDNIVIFLGYGNGTFFNHISYSTGSQSKPYSVVVDDFNNDSRSDIAVANIGSNDIIIFYGEGTGYFTKGPRYSVGFRAQPVFLTVGDVNNDDWPDLAFANYDKGNIQVLMKTCS